MIRLLKPLIGLFVFACAVRVFAEAPFVPVTTPPAQIKDHYDVVIAGAGTGGCGVAIQAARMGVSVLLLDETDWIGGQAMAAAVTSMDEGGTLVRARGLYHELVEKIEGYYKPLGIDCETAYWRGHICVEPRVGRKILHEMLDAARGTGTLDLSLRAHVTKVMKSGDTVTGAEIEIVTDAGRTTRTVQSKVLVDATEWGDVIPLTGARYRAGNSTSDAINPTQHLQDNTWTAVVKQYPQGVPAGFLTTTPPPGYTDKIRQRFVKSLIAGDKIDTKDRPYTWSTFIGYRGMPDSTREAGSPVITRTHLNFNNDLLSTVAELEDPVKRLATARDMRLLTLQLIYYFQNELGIKDWAVADDEGYDSPYNRAEIDAWLKERPELEPFRTILYHFPPMAYARESRRIIGLHTLCSRELDRRPGKSPVAFPTVVAVGDYPVDMHGSMVPKYLELEFDRAEDIPGKFGGNGSGPFAIPFESFIPEKIDGFLPAEKNISQSRMGNGATRLQPHTMNMGQAIGVIAALAIKNGIAPRAVDPVLVQRILLDARDTLNFIPLKDVEQKAADWPAIQLVSARGLLPLESGKFAGPRPLARAELEELLKQLGGTTTNASLPDPVTRGAFADALNAPASAANVKLNFTSADDEREKPITRSEAAQVVADLLEQSALAKMKGTPQTLAWTSLRPASAPVTFDVTSALIPDLQRLLALKLIDSVEYWQDNAAAGGFCDGARVADLFTRAAQLLDPKAPATDAVQVMAQNRVIGAPDYWVKNAVPQGKCAGANTATMIHNLARVLPRRGH